jgi:hypothetical protein
MTENSATTVTSAGTQSSPAGQLQPDAARDMVRERNRLMHAKRIHMIIVILQAGVGGVSDSEPGAKNEFLGVQALRIYVYVHPIMDFLPFQKDSTIRSRIDLRLWSIVLAVSASLSLPWLGPSISILLPFASAMLSQWLRLGRREVSSDTAGLPGHLGPSHLFGGSAGLRQEVLDWHVSRLSFPSGWLPRECFSLLSTTSACLNMI